ncbi:MAG: hypothetical protein ACHP7N_04925 [Caulobacterales bacterium]
MARPPARDAPDLLPNGLGAAAILAAGVGFLALGVFAFAGDAWPVFHQAFNVWKPTGPLSGVTLGAVIVWLAAWFGLARLWARRDVNLTRVNAAAFTMLLAGLALTFPPFMDLLQGK